MEAVLLASLGLSPAVVTETVDALLDEGVRLKRVYVFTTSLDDIWNECIPLLMEEFGRRYPDIRLICKEFTTIKKDDIYNEEDNAEFMRKVGAVMAFERSEGNEIYISMAGGRKTMSAAMALLGQLYGAKAIVHVLVPEEIERKGYIKTLKSLPPKERERVMHPSREVRRLVIFPVIAIPWSVDEVMKALSGKGASEEVLKILKSSGLLDEEGKPTRAGELILRVLKESMNFAVKHLKRGGP